MSVWRSSVVRQRELDCSIAKVFVPLCVCCTWKIFGTLHCHEIAISFGTTTCFSTHRVSWPLSTAGKTLKAWVWVFFVLSEIATRPKKHSGCSGSGSTDSQKLVVFILMHGSSSISNCISDILNILHLEVIGIILQLLYQQVKLFSLLFLSCSQDWIVHYCFFSGSEKKQHKVILTTWRLYFDLNGEFFHWIEK